ncbi:hypothetical protein LTR36_006446 [Oleoguttula mirabilis]|uniref:Uncharacterized protein n=1 Tax=Oleoguttula mirabilis TaxID=1507867 RepID=A0AAV9JVW4_9PEZI|nr:hypothetical protein LTR36_006446 [Oleoguttula mirabilis]
MARASLGAGKDSRKVAILTRQDSTDMRVLAGATLVFLPATFVATLFSSDFFNFQPAGQSLVSPWFWTYCVVTLAFTACIMLVWRYPARARDKKTAELLHLKSAQLLQTILDEEESADDASSGPKVRDCHCQPGNTILPMEEQQLIPTQLEPIFTTFAAEEA